MSIIFVCVILVTTLPFVASILASINPKLRVESALSYFLSNRKLEIDGFIATTIGYSLQVASIYLFLYWTFLYGIYPIIVCIAWTLGYWILSELLRRGKLDEFLGTGQIHGNKASQQTTVITTIHGFVGRRFGSPLSRSGRMAVLTLAIASTIGLGGTMITEIDYSASFFLQSIGASETSEMLLVVIHVCILLFTAMYVLWGGFMAVVFTDKFQVPLAYLGFGSFTIFLGALAKNSHGSAAAYLLFLATIIFTTVLVLRRRLFMNFDYPASRAATYLIFGSLALVSLLVAFYTWDKENIAPMLTDALFPPLKAVDFILWGGLSLVVANGLWQLIDISGLQRLQSIDKSEAIQNLPRLANAIRNAGIEAGLGWALIIVAGLLLKLLGISDVSKLMENLFGQGNTGAYLIPLLMFTVVVFMLSTISGFMSAIAYIAHYDIAPMLNIYTPSIKHGKKDIKIARLITLTAIVCLYLGYRILKAGVGQGNISAVLYAIYAFQIAIAPSVIVALLVHRIPIRPASVMASTIAGMCVAWWTATHTVPTADIIQISAQSWSVIPPLAVVLVASLVFIVCSLMTILAEKRRRGLRPS